MSLTPATLEITPTSPTCVRYRLLVDGKRIWSNRVEPSEQGHAGARARMAAWALRHKVLIQEAEPGPAPKQAIVAGRYGRH